MYIPNNKSCCIKHFLDKLKRPIKILTMDIKKGNIFVGLRHSISLFSIEFFFLSFTLPKYIKNDMNI